MFTNYIHAMLLACGPWAWASIRSPLATAMQLELWIGLVELKPLDRKAFGAAGAYTNIVTWAKDVQGYRQKAEEIAETLNMFVADIEGAEPLAERTEKWSMTDEIVDMVQRAEFNPNAVVYGSFYTYPFDEA